MYEYISKYVNTIKWFWTNIQGTYDTTEATNSDAWNTPAEYPQLNWHDGRSVIATGHIRYSTHWGRVRHICVGNLAIIGSYNALSPVRCQAVISTNPGILLIGLLGTKSNEILIAIRTFSFKKVHLKMSSGQWRPFCLGINVLTHWGRVTHWCVRNLTIIGSDNGLSPRRRQAIIWTNAGILLIGPLGTNLSEILIQIYTFSFKKMHLKMSVGKWRPFCLGLNVLKLRGLIHPGKLSKYRNSSMHT